LRGRPRWFAAAAGAALLILAPARALAQYRRGPETSVVVGPSFYRLESSGTGFAGRAGLAFRLRGGPLLLEPGLSFLTLRNEFHARITWFFPEFGLLAEANQGPVRPFLGAGAGFGVESHVGSDRWQIALHTAAGLRIQVGNSWGIRVEGRLRSVHPFRWRTLDLSAGFVQGMYR